MGLFLSYGVTTIMQVYTSSCFITLYSPPQSVDEGWVRDEPMEMTDMSGSVPRQNRLA